MIKIHKRPKFKIDHDKCMFFQNGGLAGWISRADDLYCSLSFSSMEIADGWGEPKTRPDEIWPINDSSIKIEIITKIDAVKKGLSAIRFHNTICVYKNKITEELFLRKKINYHTNEIGLFGINNWDLDPIQISDDYIVVCRTNEREALSMLIRNYND
jgi:hypothetical protein